jgi:hypothetical protein
MKRQEICTSMQRSIFEPWIKLRQLGQHGAHQRKLAHKVSKAQTLAAQGGKKTTTNEAAKFISFRRLELKLSLLWILECLVLFFGAYRDSFVYLSDPLPFAPISFSPCPHVFSRSEVACSAHYGSS